MLLFHSLRETGSRSPPNPPKNDAEDEWGSCKNTWRITNAVLIDALDSGDKVTADDTTSGYELTFISHVDD